MSNHDIDPALYWCQILPTIPLPEIAPTLPQRAPTLAELEAAQSLVDLWQEGRQLEGHQFLNSTGQPSERETSSEWLQWLQNLFQYLGTPIHPD